MIHGQDVNRIHGPCGIKRGGLSEGIYIVAQYPCGPLDSEYIKKEFIFSSFEDM